ncbi:hypothetical protein [Luteipulveratus halotolerans]|uniref:hypothetical protein n=1 Tax=Luteipulveratus halotolerans TaxID=1631356 RepID=UPI0018D170C7|nr:hypothetical protein [Luteipulveratus halotolerans]
MAWLFAQTWFWMLIAFIVGALVAWLLAVLLVPTERKAFEDLETAVDHKGGRS